MPESIKRNYVLAGLMSSSTLIIFLILMLQMNISAQCTPPATTGDDTINCTGAIIDLTADAGNDTIIIDNTVNDNGVTIGGDFMDTTNGSGDDVITNNGVVNYITGDSYDGSGSGDDTITNNGALNFIYGDAVDGDGSGNDTIISTNSVDGVFGDTQFGDGSGNDTITTSGAVNSYIIGDSESGNGSGNDNITNNGTVTGQIYGDSINGVGSGDDTIVNNGMVDNIYGDSQTGNGLGDDTIVNNGTVGLSIYGDTSGGSGEGNDNIINNGTVNGSIFGSSPFLSGAADGSDNITNNGTVGYQIETGANNDSINNTGTVGTFIGAGLGDDTINNSGTVNGDILGDLGSGNGTGNDTITNSGTVIGNIEAAGGNDNVILQNGANIGGIIDGGNDYDILTFEFSSTNNAELDALATDIAASNPGGGTLVFKGISYEWANFEELKQLLTKLGTLGNSMPFQGFCENTRWSAFDVYTIDANGNGVYAFSVTAGRIVWGLRVAREEMNLVMLNGSGDIAMYALPTGDLLISMNGYDYVFNYEAVCGPLPDEPEDPRTDIIVEPVEVETLPFRTIINRPRR